MTVRTAYIVLVTVALVAAWFAYGAVVTVTRGVEAPVVPMTAPGVSAVPYVEEP